MVKSKTSKRRKAEASRNARGPGAGRDSALRVLKEIEPSITPEIRRMVEEMEAKRSRRSARGVSKEVKSLIVGEIRRAVEEKLAKRPPK